jgi:hypothetical protein
MKKRIKSSCCQLVEHLLRKEFDKDTLFPYLEWSLDLTSIYTQFHINVHLSKP